MLYYNKKGSLNCLDSDFLSLLESHWESHDQVCETVEQDEAESLDLGNQKGSGEGTEVSGWPAYATLEDQSSCARTSLLTFHTTMLCHVGLLTPFYRIAVPRRITKSILQKANTVEAHRGLKTTYARCSVAKMYSLPWCISQWSPWVDCPLIQ